MLAEVLHLGLHRQLGRRPDAPWHVGIHLLDDGVCRVRTSGDRVPHLVQPFGAVAQQAGYGRPLSMTRDAWPNYMCCVLTVREELMHAIEDVNAIAAVCFGGLGMLATFGLTRSMHASEPVVDFTALPGGAYFLDTGNGELELDYDSWTALSPPSSSST